MKTVTMAEVEKMDPASVTIVDIRKQEDYEKNTVPRAVNLPMDEFRQNLWKLDREKPAYVLCYTGERSGEYVELLE